MCHPLSNATFDEGQRQFSVCNSCRYCEGFCAVYDAMERRIDFGKGDLHFLANLCHDCRACVEACPFTPPHEYTMNIPELLSTTRQETYRQYVWPSSFRFLFEYPLRGTFALEVISVALSLLFVFLYGGMQRLFTPQYSFYAIFPEGLTLGVGLIIGAYIIIAALVGLRSFWKDIHGPTNGLDAKSLLGATADAFSHRFFRGGGAGCDYPSEKGSYVRLPFHSLTFFGFLSALIATVAAAINEHILQLPPPYTLVSVPVVLGATGGVMIIVGSSALVYLKEKSKKSLANAQMLNLDYAFILVLELASLTGLLTLVLRDTSVLGFVYAVHMGTVIALFVSAPYGKFIHYLYRFAALVKNRVETTDGMAYLDKKNQDKFAA